MLLLAALALQAPSDLTLSMASRVRVVAGEISRRAGLRLEIAKAIPDHTVIVSLRGVPAEEALRRVAWAVYGKVETDGDLRRIVPDAESINRAKREYREWRIKRNRRIATALAEQTDASPGRRAIARLLAQLPPERWVDYDPYARLYSTHPNRMQHPLPGGFLPKYQDELNAAREKLELEPVTLGKALLTMGEADRPQLPFLAITAVQRGGGPVPESESLPIWKPVVTADLLPKEIPVSVLAAMPKGEPMKWSPESEAFLAAMFAEGESAPRGAMDPLRFDPQSYGVQDVFRTLGDRLKASVVVNVSDETVFNVHLGSPKDLRDLLERAWSPFARVEEGWVLDRPPVARPEWAWQLDRHVLAGFLAARANARADIYEARREFIAECGPRPTWQPLRPYIYRCLALGERYFLVDPGMALLARLPAPSRSHLAAGGTLPTRSLPEAAQMTLWTRLDRLVRPATLSTELDVNIFPSELFPNGLPPGELSARERLTPFLRVRGISSNGKPREDVISCTQYALPSSFKTTSLEPLWSPLIELRVRFQGGWGWESDVQRDYRPAGPAVTSEEGLPHAHREAIARARTGASED